MFPFNLDLNKFSYATLFDLFAQFAPGGIVAVSWLFSGGRHGAIALPPNLHLTHTETWIIALFCAHITGVLITVISSFELVGVGFFLGSRFETKLEPWKNAEWRKLVKQLIGEELTPGIEESASPEVFNAIIHTTNDPDIFWQKFNEHMTLTIADFHWANWYHILQAYFPAPQKGEGEGIYQTVMLLFNSLGWAGVIAILISGVSHWWFLACVLILLISHIWAVKILYPSFDSNQTASYQSAQILSVLLVRQRPESEN